jgi:OFA family oxalate/formate antiporter-like MFS transporter
VGLLILEEELISAGAAIAEVIWSSPRRISLKTDSSNRWVIASAGVVMQVALGAVYAWSVFRIPLTKSYGWTVSQVTLTFELAILMLGFASFAGGLWMKRVGPRQVATVAGVCYGLGVLLAGKVGGHLLLLYLTYGVLGGIGLGLGYIVPVATLIKWFPDKRGMITGVAVAGFGAGALITAPVAQYLISRLGVSQTFITLGIVYFIAVSGSALFMRNPPDDYRPAGWQPTPGQQQRGSVKNYRLGEALRTWQWYGLWAILFLNTLAGISIISQASPMAQELVRANAVAAAGLVGIISTANGAGRFLWAWFSDSVGRRQVFLMMFVAQAVVFALLSRVHTFIGLAVLAFIILLCYGGGFGTMPAFAADYFGPQNVGSIYGLMLTAWGFAGVLGPTLIAYVRQHTGHYTAALDAIAGIMVLSAAVPLVIRPPNLFIRAFPKAQTGFTSLSPSRHDHFAEQ